MLQFRTAAAGVAAGMRQPAGSAHGRVAVETPRLTRSCYDRFEVCPLWIRHEIQRDVDGLRGNIATMAHRRARFSAAVAHRAGGLLGGLGRNASEDGFCLS